MINKEQEDVIHCENVKPLLVEAGPGSGKTFVIVERIKFLLQKKCNPETFLVITYTRKAAKQLKEKLCDEFPREIVDKMQISTIHTFCQEFLSQNGICVSLLDDDNAEKKELFLKKHRKDLGFIDEYTIINYSPVMEKFKEYCIFNVDTPKLVDYLSENKGFSEEYVEFVPSLDWFKKKVIKKEGYSKDWYNAKYVQVARAYPIYKKLLDDYAYVDYNTVQEKVLNLLNGNHVNKYENVLIDEFQDTDPIQARIFKKLVYESETFMAVGDVDQSIYFFRGSYGDYFEEFSKEFGVDVYPLNINYRSSNEIIEVCDEFIKDKRGDYSSKKLEPYRNVSNDSYILNNNSAEEEASNIFSFIKYLDENEIINDFSDIAILNKSVSFSKTIPLLIDLLREDNIPINVVDFNELDNQDEVKSIITLLYYIVRRSGDSYSHKVEQEWGGLKAFGGDDFNPTFWNLSKSTVDYLTELEDEFLKNVEVCEVNLLKELKMRGFASSTLANLFKNDNRTEDFIELLFQRVKRPVVDVDKIDDENDRQFFSRLNEIKNSIYVKEDKPTILEIYYQLLELGGYFKEDVLNGDGYDSSLQNLATLTQTIENYENNYSKHNYKGLLSFLTRIIEKYDSKCDDPSGIQIMTVHKAKGLEFPVTIVASLEKDKFPSIPKDPERKKLYDMYDETFYTPNYCLRYKNTTEDEDNELEINEGIRVVYVAMTRAQDILLLSTVGEVPEEIEAISPLLKKFEIDSLNNKKIESKDNNEKEEEKLTLSYSSFDTYNNCPLKYKLQYIYEFKTSSDEKADMGSLVHRSLDTINHKLKLNEEISDDEVIEICKKVYSSKFEIMENHEDFEDFYINVLDYLDDFNDNDLEVIDSEVPFSIEFNDFILNGKIDLIYRDGDSIKVLDYKNSEYNTNNISKYKSQLLTYILALENDPLYKEYNINTKKASIYFLQSNTPRELNIDDDEEISAHFDEMKRVSKSINDNHFESRKSENCNICEFKQYCERGSDG